MTALYHYTCQHSRPGILAAGALRPNPHPWLPEPLVWLTDLPEAWREALGLTSHTLRCDRTAYRFKAADTRTAIRWLTYRRSLPVHVAAAIESTPGAMPAHWWISTTPVPIVPEGDRHAP